MKAQLRAIPKEDNTAPLDSKSMEEIIGRPVKVPMLNMPVFNHKLIDFTQKKWSLNSLFLLKK